MPSLMEKFKKNLKKVRVHRKMSQQKLADVAELSVSYVSMLERGARTPPLETVELLGRALRTNPVELLA